MNKKPKILFYDIESTPNLGYVWGKYEQTVLAYKKERELLSFSYSWAGDSKVSCLTREGSKTDKTLVAKLANLINNADIIVAHNGDNFDKKILKTRMVYWKFKPLKNTASVDTLKAARTYFNFNGNSLGDLVKFLGLGKKLTTPGIDLWLKCMANDPKAWKSMERYNKRDIIILKKLYKRFAPWIENHPNLSRLLIPFCKIAKCPQCSSKKVSKYGLRPTVAGIQQRWACKKCGKSFLTRLSK